MQTHPLPILPISDFHPLPAESIPLELSQVEQALQISQGFQEPHERWQAYLGGLAYLGFEQWLQRYAPELLLQPAHGALLCRSELADPVIANLEVGSFRVCLLALSNPVAEAFYVPEAVITHAESLAHLYIIVQVQEEQLQVWVQSFLRYDELRQRQQADQRVSVEGVCELPSTWFNPRSDQLLLDLQCLDPVAIPVPTQQIAQPAPLIALVNRLQPIVNVGKVWLQGVVDQLAEQLGWIALPETSLALRSPLRSPTEKLDRVLVELRKCRTDIPPQSQAIYQDLPLEHHSFRLYAVFAPSTTARSEWKLLLILGSQLDLLLPVGTRLQVSDGTSVLVDQSLEQTTDLSYLFGLVVGTWEEQFWVTIELDGAIVTLPPLAFRSESESASKIQIPLNLPLCPPPPFG